MRVVKITSDIIQKLTSINTETAEMQNSVDSKDEVKRKEIYLQLNKIKRQNKQIEQTFAIRMWKVHG